MSDGSGYPARKITKLSKYEYDETIIETGKIYGEGEYLLAVTDIEKIEWTTRIKPVKKCVHVVKYILMKTGKEGELDAGQFWKHFVR